MFNYFMQVWYFIKFTVLASKSGSLFALRQEIKTRKKSWLKTLKRIENFGKIINDRVN